jgi:hypothetical protein
MYYSSWTNKINNQKLQKITISSYFFLLFFEI